MFHFFAQRATTASRVFYIPGNLFFTFQHQEDSSWFHASGWTRSFERQTYITSDILTDLPPQRSLHELGSQWNRWACWELEFWVVSRCAISLRHNNEICASGKKYPRGTNDQTAFRLRQLICFPGVFAEHNVIKLNPFFNQQHTANRNLDLELFEEYLLNHEWNVFFFYTAKFLHTLGFYWASFIDHFSGEKWSKN